MFTIFWERAAGALLRLELLCGEADFRMLGLARGTNELRQEK
jgi:hypothetical protein